MGQEKLIIHNFGGIAHMELEFKRINLFIGPQASGKSLVVKLAYYFKRFFSELHRAVTDDETATEIKQNFKDLFLKYFPSIEWGGGEFRIEYVLEDTFIHVRKKSARSVTIDFSSGLTKLIKDSISINDDTDI